jgi:RNA recognition motif-containing protein
LISAFFEPLLFSTTGTLPLGRHNVFYFNFSIMNIFVTKLSANVTQDDLMDLFGQYGEVSSAKVIMDRETGNSKGYGFVEMDDDSEGQAAIDALNDSEYDGRRMVVKQARPREEGGGNRRGGFDRGRRGGFDRDNRGGGYGGDRGGNRGGYDRGNSGW